MFMHKISIAGQTMAYRRVGAGDVTVILESGLGLDSREWEPVARDLGGIGNVFFYDRIGRGESDSADRPRSTVDMVFALRALLDSTGTHPPYILVGHSFGGFIARLFSATYPDQVCALVLVESMHRDQFDRLGPLFPGITADDPAELITMRRFWSKGWKTMESTPEKIDFAKCFKIDATIKDLSPIPVTVVTSDSFLQLPLIGQACREKLQRGWLELQSELLGFSRCSKQMFAHGSGHFVQKDQPKFIVDVIKGIVG